MSKTNAEFEKEYAAALKTLGLRPDDPVLVAKPSDVDQVKAFRRKYPVFKNFLYRVWKWRRLPKPTGVQYDIADWLQFGPKRQITEAFRGVGKSWVTAAFTVWCLGIDPQERILVVSASKDRADSFAIFVRQIIEGLPEVRFLKPRQGQRDSALAFDVGPALPDQSPSVKSVGITGQITGSRATKIVADDIEGPKNSFTVLQRQKLDDLVKEFDAIIKPDEREGNDPNGAVIREFQIIYLGTPHNEDSLYNKLRKRGYVMRVWTIGVPESPAKYGGALAPRIMSLIEQGAKAGFPVDPERFGPTEVAKQRAKGASYFALQFMLDTSLSDAERFPLRARDLIVYGLDPELAPDAMTYAMDPRYLIQDLSPVGFNGDYYYGPAYISDRFSPYQASILAIDPAGRGKDEIGLVVLKMLHGKLYLLKSAGLRGGYTPENLEKIALMAKEFKVNSVVVEENYGDGMFTALLKPIMAKVYPCALEGIKVHGQKELRILEALEPVIQGHKLVVDRRVVEEDLAVDLPAYSLFWQMTRLTRDRNALEHDDRLDALSIAVAYFQSAVEVDEQQAAQGALADAWDEEIRRLAESYGEQFEQDEPNWAEGA